MIMTREKLDELIRNVHDAPYVPEPEFKEIPMTPRMREKFIEYLKSINIYPTYEKISENNKEKMQ